MNPLKAIGKILSAAWKIPAVRTAAGWLLQYGLDKLLGLFAKKEKPKPADKTTKDDGDTTTKQPD